ncbi:tetratricopeptide repeat protein [Lentilactobacillus kisonensis]|uniref:Tetratricopeptide repeat protein n=2 Tax=Lentilactobacillus kisonensis TaxID=481722 RepID=H1LG45_9LACO|nr:tetratricopeptide repeat protein [Lentilactobacillus kisonensis]EHO51057.1 tetratricopeptide repeat protein [Lentilactobacillus kisonensis F0435]KRL23375.1 tetratricopeptide repeat protein [Lentilactobacillus kisonensis DSM 19906 = JCM 15041]
MTYSQTALDQLEGGQLDDFKTSFQLALDNDSDDMLYSLAEELYSLGFSTYSNTIYEKLLKKFPNDDNLKINLAELAIDNDDDDKALNYLSQVSTKSPEYVRSLMVSADLYQTQGMFEISEQKLLEAQKLAPSEPVIEFALAEFYFTTRNYRKAVNLYLDLIKSGTLEMSQVDLVERLGVSYAEIGKFEQAVGYLEQIKPIQMNSDVKFELAFTYFNLKDYEKAIKAFTDLRDSEPQYSSLYPYLADSYVNLKQVDNALKAIQEGIAIDQYNEKIWQKAGQIALMAGEDDLALKYLLKGREIAPDDMEILTLISDWYISNGRYSDNLALLEPVVEDHVFDAHLAYNLALSYQDAGKNKLAANNYEIAANELGDNPDYLKHAALFYREIGNVDKEKQTLKKYLDLVPDDLEMASMYDEDINL